jgi:hypothetical protein
MNKHLKKAIAAFGVAGLLTVGLLSISDSAPSSLTKIQQSSNVIVRAYEDRPCLLLGPNANVVDGEPKAAEIFIDNHPLIGCWSPIDNKPDHVFLVDQTGSAGTFPKKLVQFVGKKI